MAEIRTTTEEEIALLKRHFPSSREGPKQRGEPGVFEISIMLAGAVSAGAYTAGVMDFLIEALDEWHRLKAEDIAAGRAKTPEQRVPHHDVILRLIVGSSAGGMNGAIAAAALHYGFPHIYAEEKQQAIARLDGRAPADEQPYACNPFYRAWIDAVDIQPMLDAADLDAYASGQLPTSLLNTAVLKQIADEIVRFEGGPVAPGVRDWLANPFEVRLTNTNLRGVPFAFDLRASTPGIHQGFLMHADQMAFAVADASGRPRSAGAPDCLILDKSLPRTDPAWQKLGVAALATGAFPVALSARDIDRSAGDYLWRNSFFDIDRGAPVFVNPAWPDNQVPSSFPYPAVDGGVMDNEPFELAHRALTGPRGRNPQGGADADRAVIVIDPFTEDPAPGPSSSANIVDVARRLLPSLISQARLSAQDLIQFQREDIYSRFVIAPSRTDSSGNSVFGQRALATGELSAFLGFFCRDYRDHDFLLGRRNAQKFLRDVFTLPAGNSLFGDNRWSDHNKIDYADPSPPGGKPHFQVIPLCGDRVTMKEPKPAWPRGAYARRRNENAALIKKRLTSFSRVARREAARSLAGETGANILNRLKSLGLRHLIAAYLAVGWQAAKSRITRSAIQAIDDAVARLDAAFE